MKTSGTYRCGHIGEINLYGSRKEREWKATRIFSELCNNCKNAKATEKAKEVGLPELVGSERQVAWANTIRQDILKRFDEREGLTLFIRMKRFAEEDVQKAGEVLRAETSAKFFIDKRSRSIAEIVGSIVGVEIY